MTQSQASSSPKQAAMINFGAHLGALLPGLLTSVRVQKDELLIGVRPDSLIAVLTFLRDHSATRYRSLMDICAVDRPGHDERFCVAYPLLSYSTQSRVQVRVCVSQHASLPSATAVYPAADWAESETWDMMGIFFENHPNLYRLFTDYGFEGHPLRKDFPLSGFTEVRFDDETQQVVTTPVELAQDFRYFDFVSPWKTTV